MSLFRLNGVVPNLKNLKVFGSQAFVYTPKEKRKNSLSPRSQKMTFIGIDHGTKGYKFMSKENVIFLGGKAIFDETKFPRCQKQKGDSDLGMISDLTPNQNHDADHGDTGAGKPPSSDGDVLFPQLFPPFDNDDEPTPSPSVSPPKEDSDEQPEAGPSQ